MAFSNRVVIGGNLTSKWAPWHASSQPSVGKLKNVLHCHKRSSDSLLSTTMSNDLKSKFMQVYDQLKSELIHDPAFEFDDVSRQWVDKMIDYNVPGGKMFRGLSVVESYQLLKGEELADGEVFLACALGWCIEWLQAYFLVLDDIIDDSHIRRGHPCWFRLPEVGMVAVNDAILLRSHIPRILKKHFSGKAYYVNLLDLFNETFKRYRGEMIDAITTLVGEKDLSKYSLSLNRQITQYKCSYYSCYLPFACALLMLGENLDDHAQVKDIVVEMGIYAQVQDDYLDTFGDPNVVGKIGTDIENFKCSWLVAKALELSNEEQKKILSKNYGIKDPVKVANVKKLYHTLNLEGVYQDYENKTREELIKSIDVLPNKAVQAVLRSFLKKLFKRRK
ncbi:farnesyl diphosphate synthase 2 [Artemisia annua]|uniref:Farnesyl diphosphate synthase 2 n=1 Tax=Artemisia annua TaxID=35608 RepID=A0A2U1N195_ARTAN|nr:farnesyl diphosphate synthase 2 [Artemisia annua]